MKEFKKFDVSKNTTTIYKVFEDRIEVITIKHSNWNSTYDQTNTEIIYK